MKRPRPLAMVEGDGGDAALYRAGRRHAFVQPHLGFHEAAHRVGRAEKAADDRRLQHLNGVNREGGKACRQADAPETFPVASCHAIGTHGSITFHSETCNLL